MSHIGPRLVIPGALFGSLFLAIFLYSITSGIAYPTTVVLAAPPAEGPPPESQVAASGEQGAGTESADGSQNMSDRTDTSEDSAWNSQCQISGSFPAEIQQWCSLISYYSALNGLPADLVAALIWQESGGQSEAYSKSGAVGLMQVMPSDGLAANFMCKNGPCFSDRPSTERLKDPEFNIKYGTRMLAGLLQKKGDLREALRSYGPMDVGYYYADIVLGIFQNHSQQ